MAIFTKKTEEAEEIPMKFSVIIPVYNKANTVCAAVESIYAQGVEDYEIIVVDDGSSDAPELALAPVFGTKLRLIRQENGGVSVARNTGIAAAQGEYICFLDADDLWKADHLETMQALIEKYPDACTFITSNEIITPDGKVLCSSDALKGYDDDFETEDFLGLLNRTSYGIINTNSVCVQRSLLEREGIGFEPGIRIGEDSDVWYRLGLKHKVALSKKVTTAYRREFSTATKTGNYVHDWIFSRRVPELLADEAIPENVKNSIVELIDRYKMTGTRAYMVNGNRKAAKQLLSQVRCKKGKRYLLTRVFTFLPYGLCRRLLNTV